MGGVAGKTHCGRWIKADLKKHDIGRVVCTRSWGHPFGWHMNAYSGWGWDGYAQRPVLMREWRCNGWVQELAGLCGRVLRATEDEARVKGWKIGIRNGLRDPHCPQCGRPDPVTAALCRDLERSVR